MLERASACLEPAAQNFLRGIESPTRSRRILPQTFWRHTADSTGYASWWPGYLDDIRRASEARQKPERCLITGLLASKSYDLPNTFLPFAPSINSSSTPPPQLRIAASSRRHITKEAKRIQKQHWKPYTQEQSLELPSTEANIELDVEEEVSREVRDGTLKRRAASQTLEDMLQATEESRDEEVWKLYISLEEQTSFARPVLLYLSRSTTAVSLQRALQAYQTIEFEDRTNLTYQFAIKAAVGTSNYTLADQINFEALKHERGRECCQVLIGHLVKKNMWKRLVITLNNIAELLRVDDDSDLADTAQIGRGYWQILNDEEIWKAVDGITGLPEKLVNLSTRLLRKDPTLLSHCLHAPQSPSPSYHREIESLAVQILGGILKNTEVMGVITPEGILRLFTVFRELGLLRFKHYVRPLHTLHSMSKDRNRSQLAVLIYRQMRYHYPDVLPSIRVYGSLISIFSDAGEPPTTFEYVLEEFAKAYERPDLLAYHKAMTACARNGHATYVESLFSRMCKDHETPKDASFFTPLLYVYARLGDFKKTKSWFNRLSEDFDVEPNSYCWNILMLSYARSGKDKEALRLFTEMRTRKIQPDSHTFGTVMGICSNAGDTEALREFVHVAKEYSIPGTIPMIDTLVNSYCLNGEIAEAESLVEGTTSMVLPGNVTRMWNILLRHHAFQGDSDVVLRTQARMREMGVKPDGMTYAALMTALVVIGKTKVAAQILRSLHLNQKLTATLFHYSIILHGYVQEENRDMAAVVYNEILERFRRPSPSARFAMLHLHSQRDSATSRYEELTRQDGLKTPLQSRTIDFMADVLSDTTLADLASTDPQPGFQRRKAVEAIPSIYVEFVVSVLNSNASFHKAESLLNRYLDLIDESPLNFRGKAKQSLQLLSARLIGYIRQQMWESADQKWEQIVQKAILAGRRPTAYLQYDNVSKSERKNTPMPTVLAPDRTLSVDGGSIRSTSSSIQSSSRKHDQLDEESLRILRTQRHILSLPLSFYLRGLFAQSRAAKARNLIESLQRVGFELTGKNWNTYIQLLATDNNEASQIYAFTLFEEKLLIGSPSWTLLRRGKLTEQQAFPSSTETKISESLLPRKKIEKIRPNQLHPTYFTMVHLARAFLKIYGKTQKEGGSRLHELRMSAPGTVQLIQEIPYLRDRIQGVLLRGRTVKGDAVKSIQKRARHYRAGLLGSESPLDHVPIETSIESQTSTYSQLRSPMLDKDSMLEFGQRIDGQIVCAPIIEQNMRDENEREYTQRNDWQKRKKLSIVRQIKAEARARDEVPIMVSNQVTGEPHLDSFRLRLEAPKSAFDGIKPLIKRKPDDPRLRWVGSSGLNRLKRKVRRLEGLQKELRKKHGKDVKHLIKKTQHVQRLVNGYYAESGPARTGTPPLKRNVEFRPFQLNEIKDFTPRNPSNRKSRGAFTIRKQMSERKKEEKMYLVEEKELERRGYEEDDSSMDEGLKAMQEFSRSQFWI